MPVGELPPQALAVLAAKGWTAGAPPEEVCRVSSLDRFSMGIPLESAGFQNVLGAQIETVRKFDLMWFFGRGQVAALLGRWLREDFERGRAGFDAAYPIFANGAPTGPAGAVARPRRLPQRIGSAWGFLRGRAGR